MQSYGGELAWSPYGDLSACSMNADTLVYSGIQQTPGVHLLAANNCEADPDVYSLACYSDEECTQSLEPGDVLYPGTYYVVATGNPEKRCSGAVGPVAFEITKAPLVVSYESETIENEETPAYKINYDGFVADEGVSDLAAEAFLPTPSRLQPGHTYTLTPEGAEAANYDISYESGVLTVSPIRIEHPPCADDLVYTGKDQVAVEAGTGFALSGTTHATKAGEYTATISLEDGYAWSDGSLDDLTYTWSIDKAELSAAFVNETIDPGASPALKVAVTGFVEGETAGSAAGYVAPTATVSANLNPGYSYRATVSGGAADNYRFTYTPGTVTVNPVSIEPPAATVSFTYDGSQKVALASGDGYDLSGVWGATDAGSYSASATLRDGYQWSDGTTDVKRFSWSISAAPGSLVLDNTSLSLKIAEAGQTSFQYVGDGTVSAASSDESVATARVEAGYVKVDAVGEGTARITVSSSACMNYTTPASTTLTVTVESIDLGACTVVAQGGTYTGKAFNARVSVVQPDGVELPMASSHAIHYYTDSACTNEVDASSVVDAGEYWVRAEAVSGGRSSGYTDAVSFEIAKATLTARYASESIEYDGAPKLAVKVSGFVSGESASNAKGYIASTVTAPDELEWGQMYGLTPSGGEAANYEFTYVKGTLSVKYKPVPMPTVAASLTYNGAVQTGVVAQSGCMLAGAVSATAVGSYTATASLEAGCIWADTSTQEDRQIEWSISKADIAAADVSGLVDQDYSGSALEPRPSLTLGDLNLVKDRDYKLEYTANTNAGTATVVASGQGNFTGSKAMSFKIKPLALTDDCVGGIEQSYPYTGESVVPDPIVKCGSSTLEKGKDYKVGYSNNLSAGNATLTVTGFGNYTGKVSVSFTIAKVSMHDAVVADIADVTYNGKAIEPAVDVTLGGRPLVQGADYEISYSNNTNAGVATATLTGLDGVSDSITKQFVIKPASIALASVDGVDPSYQYTGSELKPTPALAFNQMSLEPGKDYVVAYSENTNVGTASVTITGQGNYSGTTLATFAITKAAYDLTDVSFDNAAIVYDGQPHSLTITGALPEGVSVSYSGGDFVDAGEYAVTATFQGDDNHEAIGSMSANLVIDKATVGLPQAVKGLEYTGAQQVGVEQNDLFNVRENTGTNAGPYTAVVALNDPANYEWPDGSTGDKEIGWSIGKAKLTAAYAGESVMYGTAPTLRVSVDGFVNGENADNASGYVAPSIAESPSDAGAYRLLPSGGAADNYEFSYVAGTLTINKAFAFVVANAASKTYGEEDPELTYSLMGVDADVDCGPVVVSRADGEDAGEYEITVLAPGNQNFNVVVVGSTFTINKASYDMDGVRLNDASYVYDGAVKSLGVSGNLPDGLQVSYSGNGKTDAGEYLVRASFAGDSNHEPVADMEATLAIQKCSVAVPVAVSGLVYNGRDRTGVRTNSRYTLSGNVARNAGTYVAMAALNDPDNYCWSDGTSGGKLIPWTIGKASYDLSRARFQNESVVYDGNPHSLQVTGVLPNGVSVSYSGNSQVDAGSYEVCAHFSGDANYAVPADMYATLTITPASITSVAPVAKSYTYSGKVNTPAAVVKSEFKNLVAGTDYTLSYSNNVRVGYATVTATGIGNYAGGASASFTINPAGTKLKKAAKKKKALKITWVKQTKETSGYQLRYSLKKNMKGAKTVTVKGAGKTSKVVKKLKGGKRYYVQIRTYKVVSGKTFYSAWSKAIKGKTKK